MKTIVAVMAVAISLSACAAGADPYLDEVTDILWVFGEDRNDPGPDDYIFVTGDAWSITVQVNGVEFSFTNNDRMEVHVHMDKGDDTFQYLDVINVTPGNQPVFVISGGDDNDYITTGEAPDRVYGGFGNDTMWTFGGTDDLNGNAGNDSLKSGAGSDSAKGGSDNDSLDQGGMPDGYRSSIETLTNPSS